LNSGPSMAPVPNPEPGASVTPSADVGSTSIDLPALRALSSTASQSTPDNQIDTELAMLPTPSTAAQPAAQSGLLYVQVAAFDDVAKALALYNQVLGFGKASISAIVAGGRKLYRVRLGPVADGDEASRITMNLRIHGHDGAKIVMQ